MLKPVLKHGVTLSVLACLTNISVSLLTATWQACSCNVRSESYRAGHGSTGMGGSCRASQVRDGQGRLRIGVEENVDDAVIQILGTGSGFCFGPDLKNSGTEKGQVSEK